jgi:hypothetical protein
MSKESLEKLNQSLLNHFHETGVKDVFYYEPIFDYYWTQKHKIGICNLETYDKENFSGINKFSHETILNYWSKAPTIQKTLKIFQAISWILETGEDLNEDIIRSFDNSMENKIDNLGCGLYFNLRLPIGNQVDEDRKAIIDFYNDPFYTDYFRKFIKETELDMLIITGETGVNQINKIFPGLNLKWSGKEMQAKVYDNILFCPAVHPSREGYKQMADDLNYFFDRYFEMKKQS